jgi:hypothetical protein
MAKVPADPAIPCFALQGWSGKADKGNPFIEPDGNTPEGLTDFLARNPDNGALASDPGSAFAERVAQAQE